MCWPTRTAVDRHPNSCNLTAVLRALVSVSLRCSPGPGFSVASVSNADEMPPIERQLYGTSTERIVSLPGS